MRLNKWRYLFQPYFTYTKRERNGILVLASLLVVLQSALIILYFLPDPSPEELDPEIIKKVEAFIADESHKKTRKTEIDYKSPARTALKPEPELFYFDPNNLPAADWMKLGLSEKQVAVIHNFEKKGGNFYSTEDVRKMWVINEKMWTRIEPFIRINNPVNNPTDYKTGSKKVFTESNYEITELNSATEEQLMKLPWIGEGRAKSILRYRDLLGGFYKPEQVAEVRSIPDSVYQKIKPFIITDPAKIKKIDISAFPDSFRHPYLSRALVKMIDNYRKNHPVTSFEDIRNLPLMHDSIIQRMGPYIK